MKKFWLKIKSLFNKAAMWFSNLVDQNDALVKRVIPIAVKIVNEVKEFSKSDSAEFVSVLFSIANSHLGVSYEKLRKVVDANADKVLTGFNIAIKAADAKDLNTKIKVICDYVATLDGKFEKGQLLTTLAAMISADLSDGKLSFAELTSLVQYVYKNK